MTLRFPANIEALVPYEPGKPVEELERELGIRGAVKLASNENPYGPSPKAMSALEGAIRDVHLYPDGSAHALRTALASRFGVSIDEVVVGSGSNELIDLAFRTFASTGDHVVFGEPGFAIYKLGAMAAGLPFTAAKLRDDVAWDIDALLEAVRPDTRLLFVDNPNNPTGGHVARADLERLLRELPHHVVPVMDEAYVDFADSPDYVSALGMRELHPNVLVLRTFSKAYGLAALRVGFGIGPARMIDRLHRVRAPFNVSMPAQLAALAALDDGDHVSAYVRANRGERARVKTAFEAMGLAVAPSQTNFVLVDVKRPSREVYEALLRRGVIVRPLGGVLAGRVRITIGRPEENDRMLAEVRDVLSA